MEIEGGADIVDDRVFGLDDQNYPKAVFSLTGLRGAIILPATMIVEHRQKVRLVCLT